MVVGAYFILCLLGLRPLGGPGRPQGSSLHVCTALCVGETLAVSLLFNQFPQRMETLFVLFIDKKSTFTV